MKHIIWMAAIALTVATWSACSNDDEPTTTEQPTQQARTFTVTTTLTPRDGGTRSTMTDNGDGSISAEWQVGDQIYVRYYNTSSNEVETTATVTAVDPTTKAATITVTLSEPKGATLITFGYPLSYYNGTKDPYTDQIGTLADINANHAAIMGFDYLFVSGSNVTLPAVTMFPEMCIWKFSFKDGANDITSDITKLVIDVPNNGETYTVSPSSLSNIYVAMYGGGITAAPICITALTATGFYRKAANVTLDVGYTYTTTGLAMKKAEVGKVFGADNNIYDNAAAATTAGTTALALITYVGNDAETNTTYNHGLALAMNDASTSDKWCTQWAETCLTNQYSTSDEAKTDMAGIANTYALIGHGSHIHAAAAAARNYPVAHPKCTSVWFLPSAGQWDKMATAAGGYANLKTNAGLQTDFYWSSTESMANLAWCYTFADDGWRRNGKDDSYYVRSAIAF